MNSSPDAHANPAFDEDLNEVAARLAAMEATVAKQLAAVTEAFADMSMEAARAVRTRDAKLNRQREAVEAQIETTLVRHQPVADDMRRVLGALKMATEYERMGDYVKHFAQSIGTFAAHRETLDVFPQLSRLAAAAGGMFADFRAAKEAGDMGKMQQVWLSDQKIDDACRAAVQESFSNQLRGDGNAHSLVHALSMAKNLERIGDKIKNLVEIYYHQETGVALDLAAD